MRLTKQKIEKFQRVVWDFYKAHGRHQLPWRQTTDPYQILVSELMLQQTQVDRVMPKYEAFIKKYPTTKKLARAALGDVLRLWQGLGYNRRAKFLHQAAQYIEEELHGHFPDNKAELRQLPGVGLYTAAAIAAFAFDKKVTLVETNVRQVIIHHFFLTREKVTDTEIMEVVEKTLPHRDYRGWYAALMDYGSYLKKEYGNLARKSNSYMKQSKFKGSDREIRGAVLRELAKSPKSKRVIEKCLTFDSERLDAQIKKLRKEGLVVQKARKLFLP